MTELHQFHERWQERFTYIDRFLPTLFVSFMCCGFLCIIIIIDACQGQPYGLFMTPIIPLSFWIIGNRYIKNRKAKYDGVLEHYIKLMQVICSGEIHNLEAKGYFTMFTDCEIFFGIDGDCPQIYVFKRLQSVSRKSIRGDKGYIEKIVALRNQTRLIHMESVET